MEIIRKVGELQARSREARAAGKTVGLVPTMGALHEGHISLVDRARRECDVVIVSDFVNPTQFDRAEDLATYPRDEKADLEKLEKAGVDYVFMPSVEEMYPVPDTRDFELGKVAEVMEGARRPGHFRGVCQIVSKLFMAAEPHKAYFGQKDYQQIAVIRKMKELLGFDSIEIVSCPIKRYDDGLAMSSRNALLTPEGRQQANQIRIIMLDSLRAWKEGHTPEEVKKLVEEEFMSAPGLQLEYFEVSDPVTLEPLTDKWTEGEEAGVGCVTAYCGKVRLIDNILYKG